jgi:hypothetical protein
MTDQRGQQMHSKEQYQPSGSAPEAYQRYWATELAKAHVRYAMAPHGW